jgi:endonuclease III
MVRQSRAPRSTAAPRFRKDVPDPRAVVQRLAGVFPAATTELHYRNPFELLVATILSAQSTDVRVNLVTPDLFARYPDARALAAAEVAELEVLIKATGFFRTKTRSLIGAASALVARHGGEVPTLIEDLVELPGVGRKTANVVLGHALGVPGLPVDRHVLRVANRIGIAQAKTPEEVEQQLCAVLPPDQWTLTSDLLILHGRRVCRPRPLCPRCVLTDLCVFYRSGAAARAATAVSRRPAVRADAQPARTRRPTAAGAGRAPSAGRASTSSRPAARTARRRKR